MNPSPFKKFLLMIILAAMAVTLVLHLVDFKVSPKNESTPPKLSRGDHEFSYTPPPKFATKSPDNSPVELQSSTDRFALLRLPKEQAEAWLAKRNRSAAALLAVFRAQGDTNYLNEAATYFPNDPRVQLAILARDAYPEERRKWLDAFKQSSANNSLADYLSAEHFFKEGKTEEALKDLLTATGKKQFDNHAIETMLDAEDLYSDAGRKTREVAGLGLSSLVQESGPELGMIKRLEVEIGDLIDQKKGGPDSDLIPDLVQFGLGLSDKVNSGDSGKFMINKLVAMASEVVMLSRLDKDTTYDFLGGQTPTQAQAALKQNKQEWIGLLNGYQSVEEQMTDAEWAGYNQRVKLYGELDAFKWATQLHPPSVPQQ